MNKQEIPEEAIEAAAMAILGVDPETWALQVPEIQERYREDARNALTAAAPHMRSARDKSFDVPTDPDTGLLDIAISKKQRRV